MDLLQEVFEKTEEYNLSDFRCDLGKSITDFDELTHRDGSKEFI